MGEDAGQSGEKHDNDPGRKIRFIKDPVWGSYEYFPHEAELLRNPLMVRLNGVKQMGLAHYVAPGAQHTRLAHMWGTAHLATQACRNGLRNAAPGVRDEFMKLCGPAVEGVLAAVEDPNRATAKRDAAIRDLVTAVDTIKSSPSPSGDSWQQLKVKLLEVVGEYPEAQKTTDRYPAAAYCPSEITRGEVYVEFLGEYWGCSRDEVWVVALARIIGLLHDVGHLAYSHQFEPALEDKKATLQDHEKIGVELVSILRWAVAAEEEPGSPMLPPLVFASKLLALYLIGERRDGALNDQFEPFFNIYRTIKGIVCGTVDMDRCDYVVRDGLFTGMTANFDCGRIISSFVLKRVPENSIYFFAPSRRAAQEVRALLTERFEKRKMVTRHHKVVFLESALRKVIPEILDDRFIDKTINGLPEVARRADLNPRSVFAQLHDAILAIRELAAGELSKTDDSEIAESESTEIEIVRILDDQLPIGSIKTIRSDIRACYRNFALFADDSWIDMKIRDAFVNRARDRNKKIDGLLEALLANSKIYRTLWKTELDFWDLFTEQLKTRVSSAAGDEQTARDEIASARRRLMLWNATNLNDDTEPIELEAGGKTQPLNLLVNFEQRLASRWEKQDVAPDMKGKMDPFLIERPGKRLSLGLPNPKLRPANDDPMETIYRKALYTHLTDNFIPNHLNDWLRDERAYMPTVLVFAHRDFNIRPEDAMGDFVDALMEELKAEPR